MKQPPPRKRAPGGGRKSLYDEPMEKITIRLPIPVVAHLRTLGDGNISAGIRRAIESAIMKHHDG